ncbi:putative baseplate assembly protein [Streptomyces sp. HPF1205]|uniref:putative baseplate assembly protein n=1 Tax=Streptomyces sp. HPF1205 TaxID=2873262 RepID=UPI001CECD93B|nr:putative baseplate assembly protein [Streptomyces sp. HPF1205]
MSTDCRDERRRRDVRAARLNGVDGVEVSDDGLTLTVTFLGKAPHHVHPGNILITGGRRITGLRAVEVTVERAQDPELDDRMHVRLDRCGDTSPYRLCVVESDAYGRPGTRPYRGFDPRYHCAGFSFQAGGPTPYDCRDDEESPPQYPRRPVIDYTARDYDSLRRLVLERLSLTAPAWVERHAPDLGLTLVELLAHTADQLSYQQDAVATEAYLDTARRRVSVRRHVRLIDYAMHDGCNARTFVALEAEQQLTLGRGEFRFAALDLSGLDVRERPDLGTVIADEDLDALSGRVRLEVFEPLPGGDFTVRPEHNAIRLWTWGDEECVLPAGATSASLRDGEGPGRPRRLKLRPGDLLLLEEVLDPRTGTAAGADPAHRQVVRLTEVTPLTDTLYDQHVLEVSWATEDALAFPLCVSARGGADCAPMHDVGVARGNVVLVDHGRSLTFCGAAPESFDVPRGAVTPASCEPPAFGCADERTDTDDATATLHALLDRTRAGRRLGPDQVREAAAVVGEAAVTRAGITLRLGPGGAESVEPATADAQATALVTLIAQVTYPAIAPRPRPVLRFAQVTQAAPYPEPAQVAAAQAHLLAAIPQRVRTRLQDLWHAAENGAEPTEAETAELTVLFGASTLRRYGFPERPAHALRELIARFERLLDGKLRRLEVLTARARAGTVLHAYVVWEAAQSWGERYTAGLDPADPVLAGPARAVNGQNPRAALPAVRAGAGDGVWTPRRDLLRSGPRDRHLVGEVENDGRLALRFGDGRHGAPPPPGARLEVAYRVGNGIAGNVGADAISHLVVCRDAPARKSRKGGPLAVTRVRNPLPATGGTEPEALDDVRQLAPPALKRTRLRAVTGEDYAELAGRVPGVQRAAADIRWTGSVQEVHVAVDPVGTDAPSRTLLDAVAHSLTPYRRIGHDLVVRPATLVPLDVQVTVLLAPGHQRGHVLAELRRVLGNGRVPGGRLGFFHPDALVFGEPVRVSGLVAVAAAVPGVLSAQVTRLRRLFRPDDGELAAGLLRVGPLEVAACDNDPDRPENGRLSLVIGGGR